jgi:hypothetical protein
VLVRSRQSVRQLVHGVVLRQSVGVLVRRDAVVLLQCRDVRAQAADEEAVHARHKRADAGERGRDGVEFDLQQTLRVARLLRLRLVQHIVGAVDAQVRLLLHTLLLHLTREIQQSGREGVLGHDALHAAVQPVDVATHAVHQAAVDGRKLHAKLELLPRELQQRVSNQTISLLLLYMRVWYLHGQQTEGDVREGRRGLLGLGRVAPAHQKTVGRRVRDGLLLDVRQLLVAEADDGAALLGVRRVGR